MEKRCRERTDVRREDMNQNTLNRNIDTICRDRPWLGDGIFYEKGNE